MDSRDDIAGTEVEIVDDHDPPGCFAGVRGDIRGLVDDMDRVPHVDIIIGP